MSVTIHDFSAKKNGLLGRVSGGGSLKMCSKCESFGLQFGTVHLRLASQELLDMSALVDSLIARVRDDSFPTEQLHIAIGDSPATLVVWPGQLFALRELLGYGVELASVGTDWAGKNLEWSN